MSRKQFDRMELLTDETEVDRTFLHSKLHAIVHVPFSLCFSRSRPLRFHHFILSLRSSLFHRLQSPNPTGRRLQVPTSAKILAYRSRGSSRIRRKARAECTPPLFQAQITTDLSWFNPGSPVSGPRHFVLRPTFQRNSLLFCFFSPLPPLLRQVWRITVVGRWRSRSKRINNRCSGNSSWIEHDYWRNYVGFISVESFRKKKSLWEQKS